MTSTLQHNSNVTFGMASVTKVLTASLLIQILFHESRDILLGLYEWFVNYVVVLYKYSNVLEVLMSTDVA